MLLVFAVTPTLVWLNLREWVRVSRPFDLGLGSPLVDVYVASGWPFDHRSCVYLVPLDNLNDFHDWLQTENEKWSFTFRNVRLALNMACSCLVIVCFAVVPEIAMRLLARH